MPERKPVYTNKISALQTKNQKLAQRSKILVTLRILFFVCFIFFLVKLFTQVDKILYSSLSFISFILFILIVKQSIKNATAIKLNRNLLQINTNELKALDFDFSSFDGGEEFIDHEHPFTFDMDVFGKGNNFSQLNRTVYNEGKKRLAQWLMKPLEDKTKIINRQESVKELSEMINIRQDFIALGMNNSLNEDGKRKQITDWIETAQINNLFLYKTLPIVATISVALLGFLGLMGILNYNSFIWLLVINGILVFSKSKLFNKEHTQVSKLYQLIEQYSQQIELLENSGFNSELLKDLQGQIKGKDQSGSKALKQLAKLINAFDYRLNVFISIFLNGFFLWDYLSIWRLHTWKAQHKTQLSEWFEAINEFDALQGVANFYYNNPDFIFPEIEDHFTLSGTSVVHPQIQPEKRVGNNISINNKGRFMIVTGPNMAGKSTYLRTIGISIILGQLGAPVCAKSFKLSPMNLFSSMRTSDNLNKNESYFRAELLRLKMIIEGIKKHPNIFIILDEILKGTNSKDKADGSWLFLKKITNIGATGIVATHDLSLSRLEVEMPENITNYCFEAEITDKEVLFDYKLRKGVTTKMNASVLMRQMGII